MDSILMRFLIGIAMILVLGIASHFIGEAAPRRFRYLAFPFKSYTWEKNGAVYQKLGIRKWVQKLPDKSKHVKSMTPKALNFNMSAEDMEKNLQESCMAEIVHVILFFCSFLFLFLGGWVGIVFCVLYAVSHIPYILIQRYLRPQLLILQERKKRLERRESIEGTDFNLQYGRRA